VKISAFEPVDQATDARVCSIERCASEKPKFCIFWNNQKPHTTLEQRKKEREKRNGLRECGEEFQSHSRGSKKEKYCVCKKVKNVCRKKEAIYERIRKYQEKNV
jgi:hypothetical protein